MIKWASRIFFLAVLGLTLSCANPVSPKGGPEDETPPGVLWEESTPNLQTNFEKQTITLTFDEFVSLNDPFNQIVVSPPLAKRISAESRKTKIVLEFDEDEVLKPNTTYTINLGSAIKDFTAGNEAENMRFVFSTGPVIDSSELNVVVLNARSKEPVEDALVMLYEPQNDTAGIRGKPYYFGKTGDDGRVSIGYLRPDAYQLIVLVDGNSNFVFDGPGESIGFSDTLIQLGPEPLNTAMLIFEEALQPIVQEIWEPYPQAIFALVDGSIPELSWDLNTNIDSTQLVDADTLKWWFNAPVPDAARFIFYNEIGEYDTFPVASIEVRDSVLPALAMNPGQNKRLVAYPEQELKIGFNIPISGLAESRIQFIDTGGVIMTGDDLPNISFNESDVVVDGLFGQTILKRLEFLPGAIVGWQARINTDTLSFVVAQKAVEQISGLQVMFTDLDSTSSYGVTLVDKSRILRSTTIDSTTSYTWSLVGLDPKPYEIWLYQDVNRNGKYDSGRFSDRIQPEPLLITTVSNLRPNWDIELSIKPDKSFK